jgi:hypothetical protein
MIKFFQTNIAEQCKIVYFGTNNRVVNSHDCNESDAECSDCFKFVQGICTANTGQTCKHGMSVDLADLPKKAQDNLKLSIYYEEQSLEISNQKFEEILKRLCDLIGDYAKTVEKWINYRPPSDLEYRKDAEFSSKEAVIFIKKIASFSDLTTAVMMYRYCMTHNDLMVFGINDGEELESWLIESAKKKLLKKEIKEVVDGVFSLIYSIQKFRIRGCFCNLLNELRPIFKEIPYKQLLAITEYIEMNIPSIKCEIK